MLILKSIYNLKVDMRDDKFDGKQDLIVSDFKELPNYIYENKDKYLNWLEK